MLHQITVAMPKPANQMTEKKPRSPLRLKEWRYHVGKKQGRRVVPQEELAAAAEITGSQVSLIETGQSDTRLGTLIRIADALGIEVGDLFRDPEEKGQPTLPPAVRSVLDLVGSVSEEEQWAIVSILETWVSRRAPEDRD